MLIQFVFQQKKNQNQIKDLAKIVDTMIIIGSFTSANSKRLTSLSKLINKNTYQVTCADELQDDWFLKSESVGISAGASTPDYLIEEVSNRISSL